jgi:hypothetical protein
MPHRIDNLYAAIAERPCSCGPKACPTEPVAASASPIQRPLAYRSLCCRSGSSLNMASSETLWSSRRLIYFVHQVFALRSRMGWARELPQFALHTCDTVPSSVPRWSARVHLVVTSPNVVAFAIFALARQPLHHARPVPTWSRNEAARFALCYGPASCLPFTGKDVYCRACAWPGHPVQTSTITIRLNNQLPQPDLHRQGMRPYGLRTKDAKKGRFGLAFGQRLTAVLCDLCASNERQRVGGKNHPPLYLSA